MTPEEFNYLSQHVVPVLTDARPYGKYSMVDIDQVGGVQVIVRELLEAGLLNGDVLTCTGETLAKQVERLGAKRADGKVDLSGREALQADRRPARAGRQPVAGFLGDPQARRRRGRPGEQRLPRQGARLRGRAGACSTRSTRRPSGSRTTTWSSCATRARAARRACRRCSIRPRASPRCAASAASSSALMTDARFSGGSVGLVIGHVGPEAALGGPIAFIEDGDEIVVDLNTNELNCTALDRSPPPSPSARRPGRRWSPAMAASIPIAAWPTPACSIAPAPPPCRRRAAAACIPTARSGCASRARRSGPKLRAAQQAPAAGEQDVLDGRADGLAVPRGSAQDQAGDLGRRRDGSTTSPRIPSCAAAPKASPRSSTGSTNTPANACTPTPRRGEPTNVSHMIPRSKDDLRRRHAGLVRLSEGSMGIMGRTPDYMNMKFAAFASAPKVWAGADGRNERGARNIVAFQRRLARADISLTHTIIQPTIDKRTDSQDRRQQGHRPQGRRDGRRHHRARGEGAGHARALRRRAGGLSGPADSGRRQGICAGLRHPARHAGPEVPVPRFGRGAGRRSVRQAAVVALRRAGCLLHLRRRAGAVGPRVHRRRRRRSTTRCARPATPST